MIVGAATPLAIALVTLLVAVEVGLLVYALVDLSRRPAGAVAGGSRLLWLLLCVFVQMIGPILYLAVGRRQAARPAPSLDATNAAGRDDAPRERHVAQAAAALYDAGGARAVPPPQVPVPPADAVQAAAEGQPAPSAQPAPGAQPAAPGAAVELTSLRKVFAGTVALDGLSLSVPEGSVFGFLGPNGAGKTTTLRILAGLARPSGGSARVLGSDVADGTAQLRSLVGYLPDVPAFYKWMTGAEYLRFAGSLFSLSGAALEGRVEELLELSGLADVDIRIGGYSRGMKQRLGVAQALINAPELLLLDEPTSALDPMGRRDVLDMLTSLRGRTTVFFSTHILADVERVCDTVAILDHGRVVAHGPIQELTARYAERKVIVEVTDAAGELAQDVSREPWATSVLVGPTGALEITVNDMDAARRAIPVLVADRHTGLCRMDAGELGLEDVFVSLVGGGVR